MVLVDWDELGTEAEPNVDWVFEHAGITEADAGTLVLISSIEINQEIRVGG